ncbi:MAG: rRNA (cytidine-2'-O-)-methyltransferase, partial [Proteobacteria bacterium]|nr:rRNA (cytidine-2'-O-)-methyltransferase [Pseudomonadota bacterium]
MLNAPENFEPGLYLVATPIGHLGDLSPRAKSLLAQAECLCAEDTRRLRSLLHALGLPTEGRRLVAVHAH